MDYQEQVSDDWMVAAFVQAEFDSARFKDAYRQAFRALGVGRGGLIDHPDTSNPLANHRRRSPEFVNPFETLGRPNHLVSTCAVNGSASTRSGSPRVLVE